MDAPACVRAGERPTRCSASGWDERLDVRFNKAALSALDDPDARKRLFNAGVENRTNSPEDFARYIDSEMQKWAGWSRRRAPRRTDWNNTDARSVRGNVTTA